MDSAPDAARPPATEGGPALSSLASPWQRRCAVLTWLAVAFGLLARLREYAFGRSLWLDECYLAMNIFRRSFGELTEALDFNQGAPVGFLWLEKAAVLWFGQNEWALRLVPVLAGVVSLVLFAILARRMLGPWAALAAVTIFAAAPELIYYANETKQYGLDVAFALAVVFLAFGAVSDRLTLGRTVLLILVGAAGIFCSHPIILVLAAAGIVILIGQLQAKSARGVLAIVLAGAVWVGLFAANYIVFLKPLAGSDYLNEFWADGYMPLPPRSLVEAKWVWTSALTMFESFAGKVLLGTLTALAGMCFVLGAAWLWRSDKRKLAGLLLGPIVLALVGSAVHVYPFKGRLILFLAPVVILCIGWAFECVSQAGRPRSVLIFGAMFVFLAGPLVGYSAGRLISPRQREETRQLLAQLAPKIEAGDTVYVHPTAHPHFEAYEGQDKLGPEAIYIVETKRDADWATYLPQLQRLAGKGRVWAVLRTGGPCLPVSQFVRATLDGMGQEVASIKVVGMTAVLYDLPAPSPPTDPTP